jgi:hypothetical protein
MKTFLFKLLSTIVGLLIVFLAMETCFAAYYLVRDGKYLSVREKLASEKNTFIQGITTGQCTYRDTLLPHPYLAHVHNAHSPCITNINNVGLFGRDFPFVKKNDEFVILLTGWSVAAQMGGI